MIPESHLNIIIMKLLVYQKNFKNKNINILYSWTHNILFYTAGFLEPAIVTNE